MEETHPTDDLRAFYERWLRLEEAKAANADDLKSFFAEMKGSGFDTKVARIVFRDQTKDRAERLEQEALYDLYATALSMPRAGSADARVETIEEFDPETGEITESVAADIGVLNEVVAPSSDASADSRDVSHNVPAPIPTPDDGGNTVEPDSGLGNGFTVEVAPAADQTGGEQSSPVPGGVTMERCPPEPVVWHEYARCFPERSGLDLLALINSVEAEGVREPIVKIDNEVLDGRARYEAARQLGIEYPVVQYAGDDPLRDVVQWNLASRLLATGELRTIAAKLTKLCPDRADDIAGWFGAPVARAA